MTRLTGEFHTDLPAKTALEACADAVHGLGWEVESVQPGRIVSHPSGSGSAPTIEFELAESSEGTDIRIVGSDSEKEPLEHDALVAELDRARDAMTSSFEAAEAGSAPDEKAEANAEQLKGTTVAESRSGQQAEPEPQTAREPQTPPGWYPDAYDSSRLQYWDGDKWTQDYRPAAAPETPSTPASTETPARFRSLHVISNIYGVLGWLVAIVGGVAVVLATVSAANDETNGQPAVVLIVGALAVAFYVLMLFGISAAIRLALAVEENTRSTVELLKDQRRG